MPQTQPSLFESSVLESSTDAVPFEQFLERFRWNGRPTEVTSTNADVDGRAVAVRTYVNEFWTSRQRAAHSLHEISYRACFKPQLPRFFIERLTRLGDRVYDPFMGRGTTPLEAALLGRIPAGCDVNPLSRMLVEPRLEPPSVDAIHRRLTTVDWSVSQELPEELLVFYHQETLREICALREYLLKRQDEGPLDAIDAWIRMVAVNRLTGHSPGFFSVYTLPPNQAVSVVAQQKINCERDQTPPRRSVPKLVVAKSRSLLGDSDESFRLSLKSVSAQRLLLTSAAAATPQIASGTISLVVTSPPFLDVVDYAGDNWLRCWFCGIAPGDVKLTVVKKIEEWRAAMTPVFSELNRVLTPAGYVAFEVGEVRGGRVRLEEHVIPCGMQAGLEPVLVLINSQEFTKTAACWGVANNSKGTNTNRIVLFQKRLR